MKFLPGSNITQVKNHHGFLAITIRAGLMQTLNLLHLSKQTN